MKRLIAGCMALLLICSAKAQVIQKTNIGDTIVKELRKDDTLRYALNFRQGGVYKFTVRQLGIGIYYQLSDPSGRMLVRSDAPEDIDDIERFDFDATQSGTYTFRMNRFKHPENPESGRFSLLIDSLPPREIERRKMIRQSLVKENQKVVLTRDIDHFWIAFDRLKVCRNFADSCRSFQEEYLDKATDGLRDFIRVRDLTAEKYARMAARYPKFLSSIRNNTTLVKQWELAVNNVFARFAKRYPAFKPLKVCFAMGILNTGGTVSNRFVLVGTELAASTINADLSEFPPGAFKERLAFQGDLTQKVISLIAHECVHTQQPPVSSSGDSCPLLAQSLREGVADFVGELISGDSYTKNHEYGNANEKNLWQEFKQTMCSKKTEYWLYNATTIKGRPSDLGYYIGYRIAKTYYAKHTDKSAALKEIIGITDPQDFLTRSGYDPK
ncbi:DUF2268 domain-containing putative Zn-dependent protease [Pedobacter sp. SYP-B3415]|uniref:gliding motility protein GldB-related protein n=1 Tax=Pedobacter sp. SYP-B3415 TaxID=2496641 RepID=UPI00101C8485|nr:DUF2268 domain-containing putative Zn-dependent protease [Pedobacter sp. SYP-B3415]